MLKKNSNLIFRLLNIWFAFIVILYLSSYLPRWNNVSYHTWINEAFYFLLFLLAIFIYFREPYNKDIYLNISLFMFVHAFSFINIFVGEGFLIGDDYALYHFYIYRKIVLCFFFSLSIIYIVLKYLLMIKKTWLHYLITLSILMPVFLYRFYPYFEDSQFFFGLGASYLTDIHQRILFVYSLSLVSIFLYGYLLYKKDKILGTYINSLMAILFIFLVTDMVDMFSQIYDFHVFSLSQYVLTINLFFLFIILFRKLFFLCTEYGRFYESLINNKINLGKIKIKRHRSELNAQLFSLLKLYFYQRKNYLITLTIITAILFAYFQFPRYFTINVTAIFLCVTVLFWFVNALYNKRAKRKFTLP